MSSNDYIRIAGQIRAALERQEPFSLPAMKMAELGHVLHYLRGNTDPLPRFYRGNSTMAEVDR